MTSDQDLQIREIALREAVRQAQHISGYCNVVQMAISYEYYLRTGKQLS